MNWLEFFFGWLVKGQYNVSVFDEIMCFIEFMIVIVLFFTIKNFIEKRRKKKVSNNVKENK